MPPADQVVNYSDFMKILYKFGENPGVPGIAHQFGQMGLNSSLSGSQDHPLAERVGQGIKNQLFERMKHAFQHSNVQEEVARV